jgi:hypothetical protein
MLGLLRTGLAALGVFVLGCGGGGSRPPDAATQIVCQAGVSGVRVHLTFDQGFDDGEMNGGPFWVQDEPLSLSTTDAGTARYPLSPGDVDAERHAIATLAYPPGTAPGAATVQFTASAGLNNWGSERVSFMVDAGCVDVDLRVRFSGEHPDAGVPCQADCECPSQCCNGGYCWAGCGRPVLGLCGVPGNDCPCAGGACDERHCCVLPNGGVDDGFGFACRPDDAGASDG